MSDVLMKEAIEKAGLDVRARLDKLTDAVLFAAFKATDKPTQTSPGEEVRWMNFVGQFNTFREKSATPRRGA